MVCTIQGSGPGSEQLAPVDVTDLTMEPSDTSLVNFSTSLWGYLINIGLITAVVREFCRYSQLNLQAKDVCV